MSNSAAVLIFILVLAGLAVDRWLWGGAGGFWLARNLFDLIETLAFWR